MWARVGGALGWSMLLRVGGARLAEHVPVLCGLIRMGSIELVERCQFKLGASSHWHFKLGARTPHEADSRKNPTHAMAKKVKHLPPSLAAHL